MLTLQALEAVAEDVQVQGRVDDEPLRPVVDERAVPARSHELGGLRRAQQASVGDAARREGGIVRSGNREPVVVVRALSAVRRRSRAESGAESERGREPVAVDPHEGVPEPMHAAVAAVTRAGTGADLGRSRGPADVDAGRDAGYEAVCEPRAAAGVVAPRQRLLQVAKLEALLHRVRPPNRVHHAVAVREEEPSLCPHCLLDHRHRRARVVAAVDHPLKRPDQTFACCIGQKRPAGSEVHRRRRLVAAAREQDGGREQGRGTNHGGEHEEDGPARAALLTLVLPYLIVNVALPVVWFPAMSVASQRNSVVVVTTND